MWQRFTQRAKRAVVLAQEEAVRRGESFVGPEHLLLGSLREEDTLAARTLIDMGVPLAAVRAAIERQETPANPSPQLLQLTPRAKRVIDLAYDEARLLNQRYIGTEHLLLGLIREGRSLAARV